MSRETIVKVAETLGLAEYIVMTAGEEKSGGKTNQNNIENVMEALLAAIYLDSDIHQVRTIVQDLWFKYIENVDFSAIDPKSSLQELMQHKNHGTPFYEVINKVPNPLECHRDVLVKYLEPGQAPAPGPIIINQA